MGSTDYQIVSTVCLSSVAVLASAWIWKKLGEKEKSEIKPKKWVKVGNVKRLTIFPIKSCQGIETDKAELAKLGLKFPHSRIRDRDFLLVDGNGKQLTMVNFPKMALINVAVDEEDRLTLTAPNMPPISFACPKPNGSNQFICKIKHDTNLQALDCGAEVTSWFRTFLGDEHVRLVYHHLSETQRTFLPFMFQCPQFRRSDLGSFQNATAYHLVAEESIDELNTRLEKKSTWKTFRPTILIDGINEPFAEINWSYVKIGYGDKSIFNFAVPCYSMKINEQVADERLHEVLKNKGVMGLRLGLHLTAEVGSVISVGDPVYAALL